MAASASGAPGRGLWTGGAPLTDWFTARWWGWTGCRPQQRAGSRQHRDDEHSPGAGEDVRQERTPGR